ncbi:disease resistance protein RPS2-like [Actinidia eriantha]|uniref:disease resistance protein RPS2-like n=1 Tax=Actinidia eriantha TaxID=165200 RepID=UPI002584DEE2|nr:disease resistance protein RPS2-like [Actinidia eriantha]XP_057503048.1 disease resistance protein RPS2-like [Actinidia eriantha]XP_057503049.1 disease resistance protein RPS2-like [Actinidia eriantha]
MTSPQLHVEPPLPDAQSACGLRKQPSLDLNVVDLDLDLNLDVLPRFDWGQLLVSDLEENKARSSKIENLYGQHAVISGEQSCITFSLQGNEFREMIPKAMLLRERAMACNRRKDLLYLLMSYPPKPEADQADLLLLRDDFIKINQTIKRMEEICFTSGKQMESDVKYLEYRLDKYGFYINLYYASLRLPIWGLEETLVKICGTEEQGRIIGSVIRQIVYCFKEGELKVIGISSCPGIANATIVTKALEDLLEIRSMFEVIVSAKVSQFHSISEVQTHIAEQIHRLLGTDISQRLLGTDILLPIDAALKPYKNFLLVLDCPSEGINLHGLKFPDHGLVLLTAPAMNVYQIMPVDLEIKMEDHLLPWMLFFTNVGYFDSIQGIALDLIKACCNHLLAVILLARALKSVTNVAVWQLTLEELKAHSKLRSPLEGTSEVMVCVLKFVWERKNIVTRHCIKHCTSMTKDRKLRIYSLLSCWIENNLIETEEEGEHVLQDLMDSFLLEVVSYIYVRMREEVRDVLLKHFIPHLHPLHLRKEGLGLSEAPKVAEWDAREINLNNNELSELPRRPKCAFLVKLFLRNNNNLTVIPPSFFKRMPMLRVLDVSYTSIKALPPSVSKLVSLKEFLLRGCELLMDLPPEIGLLLNLQLLDLEGTEIMNLPHEIGKLSKLECLKVSFYGYGNSYRESKWIEKRIPMGLLSGLSSLKELSIDVNPDDEEWVADVTDFMADLHELRGLVTLKLYLPEIGLLDAIKYAPSFKFTVGHHKQRVISCLPHSVEKEFEKQENYIKYNNGKYIPTEIKNALKCTSAFFLHRHWTVKMLSEFGNENMVVLKFCLLVECNELQTIIDGGEFCAEGDHQCESGADKKPVLESLEYLGIHRMMNLRSIYEGLIAKGSLSKLKYLALHECPKLSTIFTITFLCCLNNLEELIVEDCPKINGLVSQEPSSFESTQFLPSLKKMSLIDLPELVSIASGFCIAPKLERLTIYACPILERLSPMELSSKNLEVIKGEIEWWDSLKWNESEWSLKQQQHMASIFVELKRDASLMDQLAESGNSQ